MLQAQRKNAQKSTQKRDVRCPLGPVSPPEFRSRHASVDMGFYLLFDRRKLRSTVKYESETETEDGSSAHGLI